MATLSARAIQRLIRRCPFLFWFRYGQQARRMGVRRLHLLLSFDCDTPEDIPAAEKIHAWLRGRDHKGTFAVPGVQLKAGAVTYRRLADKGADFINHGERPHATWGGDRYWSATYYHQMSPQEVVTDIREGHETVGRVIGRRPRGFRAPHFGLFQSKEQLALLHGALRDLGYRYSTSTLPFVAFRHGPIHDVGGLCEIPVMGAYGTPLAVLDSWTHILSPQTPVVADEYADLFMGTVDRLMRWRIAGVLNYYVDPAHVDGGDAFYRAIEHCERRQLPTLTYDELLDSVRGGR
jgi:hypothetical protein